jgi:Integrase zinc binding domain/Integrase core domain
MYLLHDYELSAHFGIKATQEKVKEKYYWKGMDKDIEEYVKSCDKCQKRGKINSKYPLNPIEVKEPFYQIGIDFVGPLPSTKRKKRYIIVAMDYFTKWPEAKAVTRDTAEETARFLYEDIICRHGCPQKIISDRGTHFKNRLIESLTERFNIQHNLSTSYHPQTNGLVERFNKTLCEALSKLSTDKDWDEKIPSVLFAYRNRIHSSTKVKPFYLVYGRNARFIDNQQEDTERITELIEDLPKERRKVKEEILIAQSKQKEYYDKRIKKIHTEFKIGTKVLKFEASRENSKSGKLDDKWKGPFLIHDVQSNNVYKIKTLDGKVFKTPVNGTLLKLYYDRKDYL